MDDGVGSVDSIFLVVVDAGLCSDVVAASVVVDALVSSLIVVDAGVVVSDSCCCVVSGSGLSVVPEVAGDCTGEGRLVLFGRI